MTGGETSEAWAEKCGDEAAPPFNRVAADTYLRATLDLTPGFAVVSFGYHGHWVGRAYQYRSRHEIAFVWPDERGALLDSITQEMASGQRVDVSVCPYVMRGRFRKKGDAARRELVHAVRDGDTADDEGWDVGFRAFVVGSGTRGREHVYIRGGDNLGIEAHSALCQALSAKLGNTHPLTVSDDDLMRLPGTYNYQHNPPQPVRWLREPPGNSPRPSAMELAALLGADLRLTPEHAEYLIAHAVVPEVAKTAGVHSVTDMRMLPEEFRHLGPDGVPSIVFPWRSPMGHVENQIKLKDGLADPDGKVTTYRFRKGMRMVLNALVTLGTPGVVLLVEGTKQSLAAASYAPEGVAVYGMAGCTGWSQGGVPITDLKVVEGCNVVVCLDADIATNPKVHAAAEGLARALLAEDAETVRFMTLPASGKAGLDDVLAARDPKRRTQYLQQLIKAASTKLPAKPKRSANEDPYFGEGGLLAEKLASTILDGYPAALTREDTVALYRDGVYQIDRTAFISVVSELLGDKYRPSHRKTVEEVIIGVLARTGRRLPLHLDAPLLNVSNGMLDLRTAILQPHDPSHLSSVQIPVAWNPDAQCPRYEAWLDQQVGTQADDLEEVTSTMLDPSRTPTKAPFLFGPTRSGKSTLLRLMQAMVGLGNFSAVSLHQLANDQFAAANVYGKMLNCAADMSAAHVDDLSLFKMMTGEDPIQANRKFGCQFTFTNRALFAFSANELPTIGESTQAYCERIKPFNFARSHAGREDPSIETGMMAELAGILVRWVCAYQRLTARGRYSDTNGSVRHEFEVRSDRVRQFVYEACTVVAEANGRPVTPGALLPPRKVTSKRELAQEFNNWADSNGGRRMGERKVLDRLSCIDGVHEVRRSSDKGRALNVIVRPPMEWGEPEDEPPVAEVAVISPPVPTQRKKARSQGRAVVRHGREGCSETATSATGAPTAAGRAEDHQTEFGMRGEYPKDGHKILGRLKDGRTIIKVPNPERCPGFK